MKSIRHLLAPSLIFLLAFTVYLSNLPSDYKIDLENKDYRHLMTAADVIPNTFLPYQLIKHTTFNLDQISFYLRIFDDNKKIPYFLIEVGEHKVSVYPPLTGVLAAPIYYLPVALNKIPDFKYHENLLKTLALGRVAASFYTALSAMFMYLCFKKLSKDKAAPILFTLLYALGTTAWSISSRGLWQHTSTMFLMSILMYFLLSGKKTIYIGIVVGLLVMSRPTNIIFLGIMGIFYFFKNKSELIKYIYGFLPDILLMLTYNTLVFGSPLSEGYGARSDFNWSTPWSQSLLGFLFSPARSFLFLTPPLLLGIVFIFIKGKNVLDKYLATSVIIFILVIGKWYTWDGSNGFGYRMLTDIVPILSIFSIKLYELIIEKYKTKIKFKKILLLTLTALVIYSVFIQYQAVFYKKSRCAKENNWNFQCLKRYT